MFVNNLPLPYQKEDTKKPNLFCQYEENFPFQRLVEDYVVWS